MISKVQQKQIEKYVHEFQELVKEGTDPQRLHSLIPEFYHFIRGCKAQVEHEMDRSQDLPEEEVSAAQGLLANLGQLQQSLLDTSTHLGISLGTEGDDLRANDQTQELRVNFEQCPNTLLKNVILQTLRNALDVETPLTNSHYRIETDGDDALSVRVIQND